MLEIIPVRAAVIRCFGEARALDAFPALGVHAGRVAKDELWLIGPASAGPGIASRARAYLAGADPDGLVVDHGEAWATWMLAGPSLRAAFARMTDFALPASDGSFVQGAVAQVPAKILLLAGRAHVIVPVQLGHHVPARVAEACADLEPVVRSERELAAGSAD